MGKAFAERLFELESEPPIGIHGLPISDQGASVKASVDDFVVNVVFALVIVVGALLLSMGLRSGFLMVGILAFSPIGFSPDNTGENAGSLVWTIAIALLFRQQRCSAWFRPGFPLVDPCAVCDRLFPSPRRRHHPQDGRRHRPGDPERHVASGELRHVDAGLAPCAERRVPEPARC